MEVEKDALDISFKQISNVCPAAEIFSFITIYFLLLF